VHTGAHTHARTHARTHASTPRSDTLSRAQGVDGAFTHFFAGTHHAVDFRCAVGTPVLSVAAGTVAEVRDAHACGGVHVRNLFRWNSVTVAHADGTHAEYVHTRRGSARVAVGDVVAEGQQLAESGDVGFCPEPHLHLQLHVSAATDAPTLRFALRCGGGGAGGAGGAGEAASYEPQAGLFYGASGPAPRPAEEED
jgi:murein DD-endopeptidase MepM/ murein hydrolase activator NlpD